jgi:pyruvate carboxylase
MPQTLFRIIDNRDNSLRANGIPSREDAVETVAIYLQNDRDASHDRYSIESYTVYTVKGLGRDPDLH